MNPSNWRRSLRHIPLRWLWIAGVICLVGVAWAFRDSWLPPARAWVAERTGWFEDDGHGEDEVEDDGHAGHDDSDAGHVEDASVELSEQARRNVGIKVGEVALQDYERVVTLPAVVVERPGWSKINVAAPLTGVVTGVYVAAGEAVASESLLFRLRLTHEDLVELQTQYLQTLGQLDVEEREIARLERITSGAVAGKVLLERQYERDKLQATLSAQREALLLHGLSEAQVEHIAESRKLLRELSISVPLLHEDSSLHDDSDAHEHGRPIAQTSAGSGEAGQDPPMSQRFVVLDVSVQKGSAVQAGDPLCVLGDFSELYLEGSAFERDADEIVRAANIGRKASAVLEQEVSSDRLVEGLEISHVANEVDPESRALHFYVRLPNTIVRDETRADGRHFLTWRFKAGQRMQVRVPVETWEGVIVLPVDAVAQEGPETYVFVENGGHFDRRPVHVEFRDQLYAVIANDGSVFPGDQVAMNGAHQLQMALKNKAGGGADPHAGHTH